MAPILEGEFVLTDKNKRAVADKKSTAEFSHAKFFSSFCKNPKNLTFAEREEGEEIILLLRRHFVTNVPWITTSLVFAILPLLSPFLVPLLPFTIPQQSTMVLLFSFYYLVIFGFILVKFTLWYFHTGIVTSKRLIDIDIHGILYRQISEAKNRNIEDVTYTQIGFVRSLFNYGDVFVQTAGAENNVEYDKVPRPSIVADIIGDLHP